MKLINIINSYSAEGESPRFYLKADTALLRNNDAFYIPDGVGRVVAEPHIVLKVARLAKCIGERFAPRCIDGVMAGVTFTAIDRLEEARHEGLPWDEAVGFDRSSALSLDTLQRDDMLQGATLYINNIERQRWSVDTMRFSADRVVSYLSDKMTLRIGDLIFLGSPEKFDIAVGDNIKLKIGERTTLDFDIK